MLRNTVIVDGSNIATEGRSTPSLRQLDEAVRAFITDHPTENLVVIVDATFGHRIDQSERPEFEEAILAGELITPPAGTIGRGDAFILQIADKADASVLSNDSFQELHAQYPWLFDEGRLIGGKPVPGLGWVFIMRTPVRGPVSRRVTREAKAGSSGNGSHEGRRSRRGDKAKGPNADVTAQKQTPVRSGSGGSGSGGPGGRKDAEPINDAVPFFDFVGAHPVGSKVAGTIIEFSSHGAYAQVEGVRCYVPLRLMGDPTPRSPKDVLSMGEERTFVLYALDPPRRGVDLALVPAPRRAQAVSADKSTDVPTDGSAEKPPASPTTGTTKKTAAAKAPTKKAPAKKAPATKKSTAKKTIAEAETAESAPDEVVAVKKAAEKTAAGRAAVKKAAVKNVADDKMATKKAATKKAITKKSTPVEAAPEKAATKKAATKKAATKKSTPVEAAPEKAATKKAATKKAATKKAATKKAATKKSTPVEAAPEKSATKKTAANPTALKKTAAKTATKKTGTTKKAAAKKTTVKKAAVKKAAAADA